MDPHVIDAPWPVRRLVVWSILLQRPKQSAAAYAKIWRQDGTSPLIHYTSALADALRAEIQMPVAIGMRYGSPSLADGVDALIAEGADHIVAVPLYPQHAASTVTTSLERLEALTRDRVPMSVLPPFYAQTQYAEALTTVTREAMTESFDHVVMSFHGLPERHLERADPTGSHCLRGADCCEVESTAHLTCYRHQSRVTARNLAASLGLADDQYSITYQSRLGRLQWLMPYTDATLVELAEKGAKHIAVICPAFVADNLETLEEIAIAGQETFQEAGGERLTLIPCLNDHPAWVSALSAMLRSFTQLP